MRATPKEELAQHLQDMDARKLWTVMIPLKRTGELIFEYACHEGNYGLPAILSGARAQEREAAR